MRIRTNGTEKDDGNQQNAKVENRSQGPQNAVPELGNEELRGIRVLMIVVVLIGVISVVMPRVSSQFRVEVAYLPQLLSGLLALVVVFNLRMASQRKALYQTSKALGDAMAYIGRLEQFSFIDPETQVFNRFYLDQLLTRQAKLSNRTGTSTTMLLISPKEQSTELVSPEIVAETASVLRSNFRGSDYIIRYSDNRFLVVMPDTSGPQAQNATNRLADKVDMWNLGNKTMELSLTQALATCVPGGDPWETLREVEASLQTARLQSAQSRASNHENEWFRAPVPLGIACELRGLGEAPLT